MEWFSFRSFLERSGQDSIKIRSLSFTFSRKTPENGFFELMKTFVWIQPSFSFKIDSSGARHVATDVKNGGIFVELYPTADSPDFQKKLFRTVVELRKICAHRWIELVELYWNRSLDELGVNLMTNNTFQIKISFF